MRKGRLITLGEVRRRQAESAGANAAGPLTTGIFARIAAEAAEEDRRDGRTRITPYWRTVRDDGSLIDKFPGGVRAQAARLREERHEVVEGGAGGADAGGIGSGVMGSSHRCIGVVGFARMSANADSGSAKPPEPNSAEERDAEDARVVQELQRAGISVQSVYDLVNRRDLPVEAIPVLLRELPRTRHPIIRGGIARALTSPEARPIAARPLIEEYLRAPAATYNDMDAKWTIANALSVVADDSVFREVSDLLADPRHGWSRNALPDALCNMKKNREAAVQQLLGLLSDPEVGVAAMQALGRLREERARAGIEKYLQHEDSWVRQQAKRALAKVDRAAAKRGKGLP